MAAKITASWIYLRLFKQQQLLLLYTRGFHVEQLKTGLFFFETLPLSMNIIYNTAKTMLKQTPGDSKKIGSAATWYEQSTQYILRICDVPTTQ